MEPKPFINFLPGFIASIGYYRLFFTINRPTIRWRFLVMLAVVIFIRPICMAWQFHLADMAENFLEPQAIVIMFICFSNPLSLLLCVLPGPNRLRAFVAASFVLSILHVAEIPVIYYTAAITYLFFSPFDSLDAVPQIPQRYYLLLILFNLMVMCSCFFAARWLRKTQEKPPLKISIYFSLFFISFAIIMTFYTITTWLWNTLVFMPLYLLAFALLGTLLVCIPHFALYFFSRLTVHRKPLFTLQDTASAGYNQFIGQLSRRELEVIEAVLAGNVSQKELAASLNISINTVKKHLQHIYQTTGTANMTALTVLFSGYSPNNP
jgi:DNA-binding CsgD family transcriptional regulator